MKRFIAVCCMMAVTSCLFVGCGDAGSGGGAGGGAGGAAPKPPTAGGAEKEAPKAPAGDKK